MSVAEIEAAKRRLLFSCAVCEEEGGPRADVRHTGLLSLQQHYRSIHPGQPVRRGKVQEEPPFLYVCSGCEMVLAATKSYSNHRNRTGVAACRDGECTQIANPHKGGRVFNIEMPRTVSAPRPLKRPHPSTLPKKTRVADLPPLSPLCFVPEAEQQAPVAHSRKPAHTAATSNQQSAHADLQPAHSDAHLPQPTHADAHPPQPTHTQQSPPTHADSHQQPSLPTGSKSAVTLQDALRRYIGDSAQLERRLAVYSSLGLDTIDQVRYIQRLPHAVRFYLCQYGPNASDFGQLFLFSDLE